MEKQMIDLTDKLEGYENYVAQDLDGEIYKYEYKPLISNTDSSWESSLGERAHHTWFMYDGERNVNWKESLVDLSTHVPYLIDGILTAIPKIRLSDKDEPLWINRTGWNFQEKELIATDVVNKPEHYRQGDIECIDAIKSATTYKLGIAAVCVANVIKYLWRYESKNGLEDVKKAQWYLNRLVKEIEKNKSFSVEENKND